MVRSYLLLDGQQRSPDDKTSGYEAFLVSDEIHKELDMIGRQLQQRKIPRCCLQDQNWSAWRCLYESQNDQGMITLTGLDRHAFDSLCCIFVPDFDSYTPLFLWASHALDT